MLIASNINKLIQSAGEPAKGREDETYHALLERRALQAVRSHAERWNE